jgi:cytochrome c-type biogenesis protein CcmH/NrfG
MDEATAAYQRALALDSGRRLWIELARIQTYSSDPVVTEPTIGTPADAMD